MFPHTFDASLVRPLASAENEFLQILVDRFRISRTGSGFELYVEFDDDSPSIWLRAAKPHILSTLPADQRRTLQRSIDEFFASDDEVFRYHDSGFPFRLGNGGTLPVVRLKGADYYCLFFRDTHPMGWNIANGGANTRHDLLHPDAIVERELREELIIVEPERGRWYVFDWHDARLHDHPDFARAHELWTEHFRRQKFPAFEKVPLPLKWSIPPDADRESPGQRDHDSMRIRYGNRPPIYTGQGFLNVNTEDFGIEFDRIARISVGPSAIFCDGELGRNGLLNRVIGLFSVGRVSQEVLDGKQHFLPDRVFWNGEDRTGDNISAVIDEYLNVHRSSWAKLQEQVLSRTASALPGDPFDLCPVTRTIIKRHTTLRSRETASPISGDPFRVFISFASEDRLLAQRLFHHLLTTTKVPVFFSDITMGSGAFADQIDRALDSASSFVAVGSRVEHFNKSWVKYEWRNFHNDLNSNRKPSDSPFFAFVSGIDPHDLPRPLREQTAVVVDPAHPDAALDLVAQRVSMTH